MSRQFISSPWLVQGAWRTRPSPQWWPSLWVLWCRWCCSQSHPAPRAGLQREPLLQPKYKDQSSAGATMAQFTRLGPWFRTSQYQRKMSESLWNASLILSIECITVHPLQNRRCSPVVHRQSCHATHPFHALLRWVLRSIRSGREQR